MWFLLIVLTAALAGFIFFCFRVFTDSIKHHVTYCFRIQWDETMAVLATINEKLEEIQETVESDSE